jgi:hypothetical protein
MSTHARAAQALLPGSAPAAAAAATASLAGLRGTGKFCPLCGHASVRVGVNAKARGLARVCGKGRTAESAPRHCTTSDWPLEPASRAPHAAGCNNNNHQRTTRKTKGGRRPFGLEEAVEEGEVEVEVRQRSVAHNLANVLHRFAARVQLLLGCGEGGAGRPVRERAPAANRTAARRVVPCHWAWKRARSVSRASAARGRRLSAPELLSPAHAERGRHRLWGRRRRPRRTAPRESAMQRACNVPPPARTRPARRASESHSGTELFRKPTCCRVRSTR